MFPKGPVDLDWATKSSKPSPSIFIHPLYISGSSSIHRFAGISSRVAIISNEFTRRGCGSSSILFSRNAI